MKLEVQDVTKTYHRRGRGLVALAPTHLKVEAGEFVCFLGPSGCGKSTLLNIIGGLEEPTAGRVLLDGSEVTEATAEIGIVFQQYTLFSWLTVEENAAFGSRLACNGPKGQIERGRPKNIRQRAEQLLDLVGLGDFRKAYPKELSGGMKQRVAIVRALANRPKVLLMDEPFGALDSQTREEMQELLLLLTQLEKISVVFVTHDIDEALFLGNRVELFSPRPGKIAMETVVPFGQNRSPSLKLEPDFLILKRQLQKHLHSFQKTGFQRQKLLKMIQGE